MKYPFLLLVLLGASIKLEVSPIVPQFGTPKPLDIIYPDDEPDTAGAVALGKMLFFDKRLRVNNSEGHASCHDPEKGLGDSLPKSPGASGQLGQQNSPRLYSLAWNAAFSWDGRAYSLEQQVINLSHPLQKWIYLIRALLSRLRALPQYVEYFAAAFEEETIEARLLGLALAAFVRIWMSDDTSSDRYLADDVSALSQAAFVV